MSTLPHVRLVASGTLGAGAGNEIWSCGLKVVLAAPGVLNVPVAPVSGDLTQLANIGLLGWKAFVQDLVGTNVCTSDVNLTACKASAVLASGLDDPSVNSVIDDAGTEMRGIAAGPKHPYSVAVAVTLRGTTYVRGGAAFGRFYIPGPSTDTLVDGLMSPAVTAHLASAAGKLLDFINSAGTGAAGTPLASGRVVMVGNISTSAAAAGVRWQNVNRISVDSRPDTIRRRSNKLGGLAQTLQTLPVA